MSTEWTAETDAEVSVRNSKFDSRFVACHPTDGMIEAFSRRRDAFACAERWELGSGYPEFTVEVIDRMARDGQPIRWKRLPKRCNYCFEHGDKLSMDSLWKAVERKGSVRRTDDLTARLWG